MRNILIDSCGWVAIVDSGIHLDHALNDLVANFQLQVLDSVVNELNAISEDRAPHSPLLLDLLYSRAQILETEDGEDVHADDQLLNFAQKNDWTVLTVDVELKRRLFKSGCPYIEVVGGNRLNLVDY